MYDGLHATSKCLTGTKLLWLAPRTSATHAATSRTMSNASMRFMAEEKGRHAFSVEATLGGDEVNRSS